MRLEAKEPDGKIGMTLPHTVVKELQARLKAHVSKIKHKAERNKSQPITRAQESVRIITLNAESAKGKQEEINDLLSRERPDLICIQETRNSSGVGLRLPGYQLEESISVPGGGATGLAIAWRTSSQAIVKVVKREKAALAISLNTRSGKLHIINVHVPSLKGPRDETMKEICKTAQRLNAKGRRKIIVLGDWNMIPATAQNRCRKWGVEMHATEVPTEGTRFEVSRARSKRVLDYALSQTGGVIAGHRALENYCLSDHIPVEITAMIKIIKGEADGRIQYQRDRLQLAETQRRL